MKVCDVVVIGGSAAGLQATLTLARALVSVICIDSDQPCNRYAKESHNFLSNDGVEPLKLKKTSWDQVSKYNSVHLIHDKVQDVHQKDLDNGFIVKTFGNLEISAKRLIFASGMNDNIEKTGINNIEKFWGNSIIICPYCHGFEFSGKKTGLYFNSPMLFQIMSPILYNWSKDLTLIFPEKFFEELDSVTADKFKEKKITVVKGSVVEVNGDDSLSSVTLDNNITIDLDVLYIIPPSTVNNKEMLTKLGVEFDEMSLVKVDAQQSTNVKGVKAAGDCTTMMRSLAGSAAQGLMAGASICHDIFQEKWAEE